MDAGESVGIERNSIQRKLMWSNVSALFFRDALESEEHVTSEAWIDNSDAICERGGYSSLHTEPWKMGMINIEKIMQLGNIFEAFMDNMGFEKLKYVSNRES